MNTINLGCKLGILVPLGIFTLVAASKAIENPTREIYALFAFCLLLFTTIYCVGILGFRFFGNTIGIEEVQKATEDVLATKKDIGKIADIIAKTSYVTLDASGRWGGVPPEHKEQIEKYLKELKTFYPRDPEFSSDIQQTIMKLNADIERRNKSQTK